MPPVLREPRVIEVSLVCKVFLEHQVPMVTKVFQAWRVLLVPLVSLAPRVPRVVTEALVFKALWVLQDLVVPPVKVEALVSLARQGL